MSALGDVLLQIGKKPAFYVWAGGATPRSIRSVANFINGFQCGQRSPGDSIEFGHFTRWVAAHYRVIDGPKDGIFLILEKVGGDDALAFDEFFKLLPSFLQDFEQIGPAGIEELYSQVMKELGRRPLT